MPHLTFASSKDGLPLTVMIGLNGTTTAALVNQGQPIPPPLLVRAILDTGTDITCVVPQILHHFGLIPLVQKSTFTVSGPVSVKLFEVSLSIPKAGGLTGPLLVLDQLVVMELPHPLPNLEALIGNDVLSQCLLIVDGPRGDFTLSV
jgi:hypothetical protein